jgi:hypothetical protein
MDEDQIRVIQEYGREMGNLDFSSALRVVIREWQEMKRMKVLTVSDLPRPEDGQSVPVVHVQAED